MPYWQINSIPLCLISFYFDVHFFNECGGSKGRRSVAKITGLTAAVYISFSSLCFIINFIEFARWRIVYNINEGITLT